MLAAAKAVVDTGVGLDLDGVLAVLRCSDEELPGYLAVAHEVRMTWCGPEVEVVQRRVAQGQHSPVICAEGASGHPRFR
ncbi:MAG: hypothetical protein HC871_12480 [Rhizobiales bacterium]|nr:hypothetical protein [Hyphomicrobiales bacterium]